MLQVGIQKNGQEAGVINLPESLAEVQLGTYVDFIIKARQMLVSHDDENAAAYVQHMVKAVSAFLSVDLALLYECDFGSNQSALGTISTLYAHIVKLVSAQQVKRITPDGVFAFEYKGEVYHMPTFLVSALGTGDVPTKLSVIEVIEAAELSRLRKIRVEAKGDKDGAIRKRIMDAATKQSIENPQLEEEIHLAAERLVAAEVDSLGDPNGNEVFGYYLRLLAIMCRREGERMPVDDAERVRWIDQRAKHFTNISADIALEADFFLTSTLIRSNKTKGCIGFLTRQSFGHVVEMSLKRQKHTKRKRRTAQRSLGV